jgi:phage-related protein
MEIQVRIVASAVRIIASAVRIVESAVRIVASAVRIVVSAVRLVVSAVRLVVSAVRLVESAVRTIASAVRIITSAVAFLQRQSHSSEAERLGLRERLASARQQIETVRQKDYVDQLAGLLGADDVKLTFSEAVPLAAQP